MANRFHTYFGQVVTHTELNEIHDALFDGVDRFVEDFGFSGVAAGADVTQHTPNNLSVDVGAPAIVYDQFANRMEFGSPVVVNCSLDENGSSTTVVGGSREKWLSIFIQYTTTQSDPRTDDLGNTVYYRDVTGYKLNVVQGAEAPTGTAIKPSLRGDQILLADVLLAFGATALTNANISNLRSQTVFNAVGSPLAFKSKGLADALQNMTDAINSSIATTAGSVAALNTTLTNRFNVLEPATATALALSNATKDTAPASGMSCADFASNGTGRIATVGDSGNVQYSDDGGLTWNAATLTGGYTDQVNSVVWNSTLNLWVLAGGSTSSAGTIQTSPDLTTFTQRKTTSNKFMGALTVGAAGVMCCVLYDGSAYKTVTSSDGTTWTEHAQTAHLSQSAMAFGNNLFVSPEDGSGTHVYRSPDGITWTASTWGSGTSLSVDIGGLVYSATAAFFTAWGGNGSGQEVQTSTDGSTWVRARAGSGGAGALIGTPIAAFCMTQAATQTNWVVIAGACDSANDFKCGQQFGGGFGIAGRAVKYLGRSWVAFATGSGSGELVRSPIFFA